MPWYWCLGDPKMDGSWVNETETISAVQWIQPKFRGRLQPSFSASSSGLPKIIVFFSDWQKSSFTDFLTPRPSFTLKTGWLRKTWKQFEVDSRGGTTPPKGHGRPWLGRWQVLDRRLSQELMKILPIPSLICEETEYMCICMCFLICLVILELGWWKHLTFHHQWPTNPAENLDSLWIQECWESARMERSLGHKGPVEDSRLAKNRQ